MSQEETIESLEKALVHEKSNLIHLEMDTELLEVKASQSRRKRDHLRDVVSSMERRLAELKWLHEHAALEAEIQRLEEQLTGREASA